jgi:hypothetical protein
MLSSFLLTALIIHAALALTYALAIAFKWSSLPPAFIPMLIFIPLFGFLAALTADLTNRYKGKLSDPGEIETVKLEKDIYWKSIRKQSHTENVVPLEEALIINDRQTRKKLVLDTLLDDPMKNIDILLLARENNDVDTAHYANTTIAKIQRDFQLQIQKLAAAHESDRENSAILEQYLMTLIKFIESGLSEAYLLKRQRIILAALLDEKIKKGGWSKEVLQIKIDNAIALQDINIAIETNEIMHQNFPDDEQTWINELKISVAAHDPSRLENTIRSIKKTNIDWSIRGREKVSAWIEVTA